MNTVSRKHWSHRQLFLRRDPTHCPQSRSGSMSLSGSDATIMYNILLSALTAHAVHWIRQLEACLRVIKHSSGQLFWCVQRSGICVQDVTEMTKPDYQRYTLHRDEHSN